MIRELSLALDDTLPSHFEVTGSPISIRPTSTDIDRHRPASTGIDGIDGIDRHRRT